MSIRKSTRTLWRDISYCQE